MRKILSTALTTVLTFGLVAGCGGGNNPMTPPQPANRSAQVSLSMTDAPPAGITLLTFEVSVTGATLNPGNVDVLAGKGPFRIEVKKLETETAFLSTANIVAGNYTSLNLTFANPELTFMNNTGAMLAGCANGTVCQVQPSGTLSSTVNGNVSVMAGTQTGLLVDVSLASLLSSALDVDFSSSGAVTVSQQTIQGENELEDLDDIDGILKSPADNQFTLQTSDMGNINVSVDSNTQFKNFENCAADNFSCLADGESIEAELNVTPSGTFVAKKIELRDDVADANNDELDGVIFKVDSASQFEVVVIDELRDVSSVSVGDPIVVTLQTSGGGSSFQVDASGTNIPSSLRGPFEGASDTSQLIPGQTVQIRKRAISGGPSPLAIMVTTDRVRLEEARFTAAVSGAPNGSNFNIGNLPGLFTSVGVTGIQVQTSSQTNFDNVAGVSGLADGSVVSLRGLLFKSATIPVLIADKVRQR
jgi:hypothetical protein